MLILCIFFMKKIICLFFSAAFCVSFNVDVPSEKHFKNLRQLTFGGDNAEAYFSFDGKSLSFQSNNKAWGLSCDQVFNMNIKKAAADTNYKPPLISTGKGRCTCAYFLPGNKTILYASTHAAGDKCPETGDLRKGGKYLWPVFSSYDIYVADLNGKIIKQLTNTEGYDAEATVSPKKDKIVFTSSRSG